MESLGSRTMRGEEACEHDSVDIFLKMDRGEFC